MGSTRDMTSAQAELVDAVFEGELVERVGLLVRGGETPVHIGDVGWDVIGARLLDRAPQVELRDLPQGNTGHQLIQSFDCHTLYDRSVHDVHAGIHGRARRASRAFGTRR